MNKALKRANKIIVSPKMPCFEHNGYTSFTKTKNVDFKILQLTDLHIGGGFLSRGKDAMAINAITKTVNKAKPDLIVITGDCVYPVPFFSGTRDNLKSSKIVGELMESFGIPWTLVFGNHDVELASRYTKKDLCDYYESLPHCLFKRGEAAIQGEGNHIINILNEDGSINNALVMLDSNQYLGSNILAGYDTVHYNQCQWYKNEILKLSEEQKNIVPSLAFFHIPLIEFKQAWNLLKTGSPEVTYHSGNVGETNDYFGVSYNPSHFFDEAVRLRSTKGIFCGHDHLNTISLTYKGVRMTYGMSIDYLAYIGIKKRYTQRGGTLIKIKDDASFYLELLPLTTVVYKDEYDRFT